MSDGNWGELSDAMEKWRREENPEQKEEKVKLAQHSCEMKRQLEKAFMNAEFQPSIFSPGDTSPEMQKKI